MPISEEHRNALSKEKKGDPDVHFHCTHCGEPLFNSPKCKKCDSLLTKGETAPDTEKDGCKKCRQQALSYGGYSGFGYSGPDDDGIPF